MPLLLLVAGFAQLAAEPTPPSIDPAQLVMTDIDGQPVDGRDHAVTVVVFLKTGCPIANYYHPTLRRLAESWEREGNDVALVQVHATATVTAEQAAAHREEYAVAGAVVVDPSQRLARTLAAEVTPEAFVLTADGHVHYHGRIDDTYVSFGRRRQVASEATLADAVAAVLAGRTPRAAQVAAVGCRIHYVAASQK